MEYILGFGSPHRALKAEEALKKADLAFRLLPVPRALDASCGLVIRVSGEDLEAAKSVLEKSGIKPRNIYQREGDDYVKV